MDKMKSLFTTGEAAEICNISQQTIIRCFDSGRLDGFRIPGSRFRRIPRENLIKFMKDNGIPLDNLNSEKNGKIKVLIVDDDDKLRKLLVEYLEGYGYSIETLADGRGVQAEIGKQPPDIVILDIMLPHKNGLEVLRDIRRISRVPVVMLTAKGDDADRIVGLEMGADDYLPKPFNPRELLARIKAVLRRVAPDERAKRPGEQERALRAGGLVLDKAKQTVHRGEREISLSTTEFKLLRALMEHPNQVLTRDRLMNLARGREFEAFDRSIDVHISKLRAKLEPDPKSPERIKTVWGSGYMFVDPS